MLARSLDRERVGVGIPPGRMDDRRVHAALVHLLQHVGGGEVDHLAMVRVRRLVVPPDVDLRVDDQHRLLLSLRRVSLAEIPVVFKLAPSPLATAKPPDGESTRPPTVRQARAVQRDLEALSSSMRAGDGLGTRGIPRSLGVQAGNTPCAPSPTYTAGRTPRTARPSWVTPEDAERPASG